MFCIVIIQYQVLLHIEVCIYCTKPSTAGLRCLPYSATPSLLNIWSSNSNLHNIITYFGSRKIH